MTMRPRSFDPEAATETAVSGLLRREAALEDPAPVVPGVAVSAAGAVEPAFLIASDLADDLTKAVAHYQCGQSGCEVEIQAALTALPLDGDGTYITRGTVVLSEGAFRCDGTFTIPEGARLVGSGVGTVLYANDDANMLIVMEDRSEIGNLSISSAPGS